MRRGYYSVAAMLAALALGSPGAFADVYRCEVEGKVVYSDRPCKPDAKPVKVDPNTVGEIDQREATKKRQALDARINARIAVDAAQRDVDRARAEARRAECDRYADEIRRQSVWAGDFYLGPAAAAEIEIAKRRAAEAGCR